MRCFDCGEDGHIAPNCRNREIDANGKPPWCGFCDERTRLIEAGDIAARCQRCHPSRRQMLKQHRKCPHCHMTVFGWDSAPCGSHSGPSMTDKRPDRRHIREIREGATADA